VQDDDQLTASEPSEDTVNELIYQSNVPVTLQLPQRNVAVTRI